MLLILINWCDTDHDVDINIDNETILLSILTHVLIITHLLILIQIVEIGNNTHAVGDEGNNWLMILILMIVMNHDTSNNTHHDFDTYRQMWY